MNTLEICLIAAMVTTLVVVMTGASFLIPAVVMLMGYPLLYVAAVNYDRCQGLIDLSIKR